MLLDRFITTHNIAKKISWSSSVECLVEKYILQHTSSENCFLFMRKPSKKKSCYSFHSDWPTWNAFVYSSTVCAKHIMLCMGLTCWCSFRSTQRVSVCRTHELCVHRNNLRVLNNMFNVDPLYLMIDKKQQQKGCVNA